jgi:DNA polymerase (family 10)
VRDPDNARLAERLEAFGSLLELSGANFYTARAYRRAADLIRSLPTPVVDLVHSGRVRELRGIGPSIEARLRELVENGEIAELKELERSGTPQLVGFGRLLGLSPKRMLEIGRALDVTSVDAFREAALAGRLREVPGIGSHTESKILASLDRPVERPTRGLLLNRSRPLVEEIAAALDGEPAGEPRRWRDASVELAVVCAAEHPGETLARFEALPQIVAVVGREERRAVGITVEGIPIVLVVAEPHRFGTELVRATGSGEYVEALEPLPDSADEAGVYRALGIPLCPPELRERAFRGEPPPLLELGQLRGDLHCHTTWSDGKATVYEMGEAARMLGYEYLAICDHTKSVGAVPGLDADDLRRQAEEIAAANERLAPFRVLRGAECDILSDGSLDLPDHVLAELEWVQASVHGGQRQSREQLTKRSVEALANPYVSALSHPTGRLINHRPPNAVDLEAVFATACAHGKVVEVNGLPDRLDLRDEHVRLAIEAGVPIVVSTDAHSVRGLGNMVLAVATARRGWATAADVVNTRPLAEILALRPR